MDLESGGRGRRGRYCCKFSGFIEEPAGTRQKAERKLLKLQRTFIFLHRSGLEWVTVVFLRDIGAATLYAGLCVSVCADVHLRICVCILWVSFSKEVLHFLHKLICNLQGQCSPFFAFFYF